MAFFRLRMRNDAALATLFATVLLVVVQIESFVLPGFDLYREQTEFARRSLARLSPEERVYLYEVREPQIVYYLREPMERFDEWGPFVERVAGLKRDVEITVVAPVACREDLERLGRVNVLEQCSSLHRLATMRLRPDLESVSLAVTGSDIVRR